MHIMLCHLITHQEHQHAWLPAPDPGTQVLAAHCQTPITRLEPHPKFVPSNWTCLLPTAPTGLPPLACSSPASPWLVPGEGSRGWPKLLGFPSNSASKESTCNAGDPSLIPRSRRSTGEGLGYPVQYSSASLVAQMVKNTPATWETWVRSLGWEDPLEKGIGYPLQSSGLENSMDCIVHGSQRVRHD